MMRLQQITGGFVGLDDKSVTMIRGENPRLNVTLEIIEDVQGKMIIWARFIPEIKLIVKTLRERYGSDSVVEFYGDVSTEDRTINRKRFQDPDDPVRFFVGNQQCGGMGVTLTEARTVIYYSNTFSLEDRLQTEKRCHRIGLRHSVTYIDLVAKGTRDRKIVAALREKKRLADVITGDMWRDWI
jgi:SNF2 family DNA or RNA helicase